MPRQDLIFFQQIKTAITSNPFSNERKEIDLQLTSLSPKSAPDKIIQTLTYRVAKNLQRLSENDSSLQSTNQKMSSELIKFAKLFHVFHLYVDHYDELIKEQIKKGSDSCQVKFAPEILALLSQYGFTHQDSVRYFALFFQMRRAFFFISRISGQSKCVQELKERLWNNIFTCNIQLYENHLWNRLEDFSTMLLGDTGSGKSLAASAIGRSGFIPFDDKKNRFQESFANTFLSINLSQFPEQLIESELFGHKKGAFTGAIDSHHGIFSQCNPHGAIFLDEIGDVSVPIQIKLLQVLQERSFSSVGSRELKQFKGRVIAATNKPVEQLRCDGEMRDDFYYRLCSDVITIPPLQQRIAENPNELATILSFIVKKIIGKPSSEITAKITSYIHKNQPNNYSWPGNIRELEQCARRVLINNHYTWQQQYHDNDAQQVFEKRAQQEYTAQELLTTYCKALYKRHKTYEAVAKVTGLDRRTVKRYIQLG